MTIQISPILWKDKKYEEYNEWELDESTNYQFEKFMDQRSFESMNDNIGRHMMHTCFL